MQQSNNIDNNYFNHVYLSWVEIWVKVNYSFTICKSNIIHDDSLLSLITFNNEIMFDIWRLIVMVENTRVSLLRIKRK